MVENNSGKKTRAKPEAEQWFNLHTWVQWWWQFGVPRPVFLSALFIGLLGILSMEIPHLFVFAAGWIGGTAPLWLPIVLVVAGWSMWVDYIQALYISNVDTILLEVKIPREMSKSPRAMEIALNTLWQTSGETDFIKRAWVGRVRPWFSFEIASFGGDIHFYIWTWEQWRNVVEAGLYAQFPDIEIHTVEDYASRFQYDSSTWDGFVGDYKLSRGNAYPIKSYIDFELDKDPKEEFKVEPLAQMFEYLSSLRPHEQVWIQIIIRSNKSSGSVLFPQDDRKEWEKLLQKEVERIRLQSVPEEMRESVFRFPNPTWRQKQQMEVIERHLGKVTFDVCVRGIYLVDQRKGSVHGPNISILRFIWKPLSDTALNELGPDNSGGHNIFSYPWQDYRGMYREFLMRRYLDAYRRRACFYSNTWTAPINVLSVESLATLWHFPSSTVAAPGLVRIPATKAAPPPNLPI
jgi:hypothetical protein